MPATVTYLPAVDCFLIPGSPFVGGVLPGRVVTLRGFFFDFGYLLLVGDVVWPPRVAENAASVSRLREAGITPKSILSVAR